MDHRRVDVAIIGAGTAGLAARREVEQLRRDYVLIERGPFGTTCARVGCMPSKLLIAAAEAAHEAREAGRFGVRVGDVSVDGPAVLDRVRRERDRFVSFVTRATDALPEERRLVGEARFEGPHSLRVWPEAGGKPVQVEFRSAVIATGSSAWIPPQLDPVRDRVLVNDDVFELPDIPRSVAVFGTGVIAIELGQALQRLGARVAFFNPFEVVGPITDPAVGSEARRVFAEELTLNLGIREVSVSEADDGGVTIRWVDPEGEHHCEHFEQVLAAAGRRPNLAKLQLDRTGVQLNARGQPPCDPSTMQIGDSHLFIAGDATNERPLLHEAADEGRIAGRNAAVYPEVRAGLRRTGLAIVFTDPQIAVVGKCFSQLDQEEVVVGEVSYADQGRARVMGKNRGLVRLYATRACGELLGAEMLGPAVEHTAHLLAWAVQKKVLVTSALELPFYHPVVEEGIRTALRDAAEKLRLHGRSDGLECGPGG